MYLPEQKKTRRRPYAQLFQQLWQNCLHREYIHAQRRWAKTVKKKKEDGYLIKSPLVNYLLSSCLFAFLLLLLPIHLLCQCAYISDDCFVSSVQIVVHADHVLSSFGEYKLRVLFCFVIFTSTRSLLSTNGWILEANLKQCAFTMQF